MRRLRPKGGRDTDHVGVYQPPPRRAAKPSYQDPTIGILWGEAGCCAKGVLSLRAANRACVLAVANEMHQPEKADELEQAIYNQKH